MFCFTLTAVTNIWKAKMNKQQIITFVKKINLFVYLRRANESIPLTHTLDIDKCLFRCVLHIITNLATLLSWIFIFLTKRATNKYFFHKVFAQKRRKETLDNTKQPFHFIRALVIFILKSQSETINVFTHVWWNARLKTFRSRAIIYAKCV